MPPCTGSNRQAKEPRTGQLLGPSNPAAIGALAPGSGNLLDSLFLSGQGGIPTTAYNWPALAPGPRFGIAYEFTGNQDLILRGGGLDGRRRAVVTYFVGNAISWAH